ncbi:hypothetical protein GCM10023168_17860 [Fodinibacter luteus]|uniref:Zinc finger protein n=1 Tax=Fodinibacter luteus TaxID=552064 RepID=A0ABP8KFA4_9MICO
MSGPRTPWHVDDETLSGYVAGTTSPVLSTSVETHLLSCATCRERLAAAADAGPVHAGPAHAGPAHAGPADAGPAHAGPVQAGASELDVTWQRLADAIDRPSPGILGRFGSAHRFARSTIATPTMLLAALSAVALVVIVPLAAAAVTGDAGLVALLVAAPLAPVAAVALAYRDQSDPAGEMSLATPSAGLRLVALRAVLVAVAALVAATVALLLVGVWVDLTTAMVLAWCLPGLALSALVLLSGTTRLDPARVAGVLSIGWAGAVVAGSTVGRRLRPEVALDVIASPALQTAALTVALTALLLTVARRDTVSYRRTA